MRGGSWQKSDDGIVHITLPGADRETNGNKWIETMDELGISRGSYVGSMLNSVDFNMVEVGEHELVAVPVEFFTSSNGSAHNIRLEAMRHGWDCPYAQDACLFAEAFSRREFKEMGLKWLVVMHKPITPDVDIRKLLLFRIDSVHSDLELNPYSGADSAIFSPEGTLLFAVT